MDQGLPPGVELKAARQQQRLHHGEITRHDELAWRGHCAGDVNPLGLVLSDEDEHFRLLDQLFLAKALGDGRLNVERRQIGNRNEPERWETDLARVGDAKASD